MGCCRLLCGLVLLVLALLLASPPASLLCHAGTNCPMALLGPYEAAIDLSPKALMHMFWNIAARRLAGPTGYIVVHIAPSVSDESDTLPPAGAKAMFPPGGVFLLYAEPNGEVLGRWQEHLQALGIGKDEAAFVRTAICKEDSKAATLHRVSQQFRFDFLPQEKPDVISEHASTNRTRLISMLRMLSSEVQSLDTEKLTSYLVNETVRCASPATFLREAGVSPRFVEQLHIDVPGEDGLEIVEAFMELGDFHPHTVGFEFRSHHNYEPEVYGLLERVVRTFSAQGYTLHRAQNDILALAA